MAAPFRLRQQNQILQHKVNTEPIKESPVLIRTVPVSVPAREPVTQAHVAPAPEVHPVRTDTTKTTDTNFFDQFADSYQYSDDDDDYRRSTSSVSTASLADRLDTLIKRSRSYKEGYGDDVKDIIVKSTPESSIPELRSAEKTIVKHVKDIPPIMSVNNPQSHTFTNTVAVPLRPVRSPERQSVTINPIPIPARNKFPAQKPIVFNRGMSQESANPQSNGAPPQNPEQFNKETTMKYFNRMQPGTSPSPAQPIRRQVVPPVPSGNVVPSETSQPQIPTKFRSRASSESSQIPLHPAFANRPSPRPQGPNRAVPQFIDRPTPQIAKSPEINYSNDFSRSTPAFASLPPTKSPKLSSNVQSPPTMEKPLFVGQRITPLSSPNLSPIDNLGMWPKHDTLRKGSVDLTELGDEDATLQLSSDDTRGRSIEKGGRSRSKSSGRSARSEESKGKKRRRRRGGVVITRRARKWLKAIFAGMLVNLVIADVAIVVLIILIL